ncbi:hypothetical protein T08_615 [Trichinella sp. T8]|nr:hypothetical protein T08_615 [Trichinella sp. T8]
MEILFVIFFILTINIRNFSIKEDTETVTNNLTNWWNKLKTNYRMCKTSSIMYRFKYSIEQEEEKELFIVRLEIMICSIRISNVRFFPGEILHEISITSIVVLAKGWGDWLIAFSWSIVVENLLSTMITC